MGSDVKTVSEWSYEKLVIEGGLPCGGNVSGSARSHWHVVEVVLAGNVVVVSCRVVSCRVVWKTPHGRLSDPVSEEKQRTLTWRVDMVRT